VTIAIAVEHQTDAIVDKMDVLLAMWYLILAALTRCATAQFPSGL